ncbi:MAG: prepilin-type N-terminal cleavage/methylation domain-containing protein [Deltaproteobacteria bacterium]|nr:prepilin-type N-terminal cleavage/methylation domain-containing protein [Deltaproteobacteria bacterium]
MERKAEQKEISDLSSRKGFTPHLLISLFLLKGQKGAVPKPLGIPPGLRGGAGFTLLEVAIALAILAGVVITALTVLNHHLSVAEEDKQTVLATLLAREKIEEIRFKGLPEKRKGSTSGLPGYLWGIYVQELPYNGLQRVEVRVSWDKGRREVALATYMAR